MAKLIIDKPKMDSILVSQFISQQMGVLGLGLIRHPDFQEIPRMLHCDNATDHVDPTAGRDATLLERENLENSEDKCARKCYCDADGVRASGDDCEPEPEGCRDGPDGGGGCNGG